MLLLHRFTGLLGLVLLAGLLAPTVHAQGPPLSDRQQIPLRSAERPYFFPYDLAAGDLDADGLADLVATGTSVAVVTAASGRTPVRVAPTTPGTTNGPVVIGDFNEDGRPDLAVGRRDSATVAVQLHGPDAMLATFGDPTYARVRPLAAVYVEGLAAVDVDGDGHLDLVAGLSGGPELNDGALFFVLLGRGDGTFGEAINVPLPDVVGYGDATAVATGDLDGDGRPDLVLTTGDHDLAQGRVLVFLNRSSPGALAFETDTHVTATWPQDTVLADLDEDGTTDLVTATRYELSVLFGMGGGRFAPAVAVPVPPGGGSSGQLWDVAAADFDLDGHLDVVVSHAIENVGDLLTSFLKGDGAGGLTQWDDQHGVYGYYAYAFGLVAEDLTGDGRPDLAFVSMLNHDLNVFVNQANAPIPHTPTLPGAFSSQFGDALDGYVSATAIDGEEVFVGGAFTTAGGVPARKVAVYNRRTGGWAGLGDGVDGDPTPDGDDPTSVGAVAVTPGYVYIAGAFTSVSGVEAHGLARWNRQTGGWEALAGDFEGTSSAAARFPVDALAAADGGVYVGGSFRELPRLDGTTLNASGVAFFEDATGEWAALGGGINTVDDPTLGDAFFVTSLLPVGRDIYVGGFFNLSGGEPAAGMARWSRSTRSWAVPPGVTLASGGAGIVRDLRAFGGEVYAVGLFDLAGGAPAYSVARYRPPSPPVSAPPGSAAHEPGTWRPVGDPEAFREVGGSSELEDLWAVEVAPDGGVIVGGSFERVLGGQTAESLAAFDPASGQWRRVGAGLDREYYPNGGYAAPTVFTLALAGSDLVVGGSFPSAGGVVSRNLALYRLPAGVGVRIEAAAIADGVPVTFQQPGADAGVSVVFTGTTGDGAVTAARLETDALEPVFEGTVPDVLAAVRYVIEAQGGFGFTEAEVRFALADLFPEGLSEDAVVTVYRRPTPNEGTFTALPTQVENGAVVAVTTGFSEFVVGASMEPATATEGGTGRFALAVVGPNPTAGRTALRLTLPAAGDAEVTLFDVLGRRVGTLAAGPMAAGTHLLPVDGGALAAGVYVARLDVDGQTRTLLLTVAR